MTAQKEYQIIACTVQVNTKAKHRLLFVSTKHTRQRAPPHLTLSLDISHNSPFYQSVGLLCFVWHATVGGHRSKSGLHLKTETHRAFFFCCPALFSTQLPTKQQSTRAVSLTVCLSVSLCSLRAARKPTLAWRTSKPTSGPTPGRSRMCVSTKAATRPSPTPRTGPSTRTAHTRTRYVCTHTSIS